MSPAALVLPLHLLLQSFGSPAAPPPTLAGYVTAISPAGDLDVNGQHIQATPTTLFEFRRDKVRYSVPHPAFHLGQTLAVYGKQHKSSHSVTVSRVVFNEVQPTPVSGNAIIDLLPPPVPSPSFTHTVVRADGYLLYVTSKTHLTFAAPLTPGSPLATNQWIQYKGIQQPDGHVDLTEATITQNLISHKEDKLRTRSEYDPAAVDPDSHQSGLSKLLVGTDLTQVPPHDDPVMLARVQRIGQSLVPAYQRALPLSDPTRIPFRFQLVDAPDWHDAHNLPNGIVVISYQIVDRLDSDSELAAILAANIVEALEKDLVRVIPVHQEIFAGESAGVVAGLFVPVVGIGAEITAYKVAKQLETQRLQQVSRVSLCLLHDAGYDLAQAPIAWWRLAPRHPQPLDRTALPDRAAYLYEALGSTWPGPPAHFEGIPTRP